MSSLRLIISQEVRQKLASKIPAVSEVEIRECFENRLDDLLKDNRAEHRTKPPTMWFIAETNHLRRLKVVFIQRRSGDIIIKTAYEPDETEEWIYGSETRAKRD